MIANGDETRARLGSGPHPCGSAIVAGMRVACVFFLGSCLAIFTSACGDDGSPEAGGTDTGTGTGTGTDGGTTTTPTTTGASMTSASTTMGGTSTTTMTSADTGDTGTATGDTGTGDTGTGDTGDTGTGGATGGTTGGNNGGQTYASCMDDEDCEGDNTCNMYLNYCTFDCDDPNAPDCPDAPEGDATPFCSPYGDCVLTCDQQTTCPTGWSCDNQFDVCLPD